MKGVWNWTDVSCMTVRLASTLHRKAQRGIPVPTVCTLPQHDGEGKYTGRNKKLPHEARSSFAEEMIERFHLKGLENHYPAQLSGGQQQRTALARITVSRPGAILLDESFSALDSYLKLQMEEELHTFLEEYPGEVILVSHIGKREEEKLTAGEHIVVCIDGNDVAFLSEH